MLDVVAETSTKGTEYLIAIAFLAAFLVFLRLLRSPRQGAN